MRNWADIQSLLNNRVPESEILDYKRDCYGKSDSHKRELLKDVSSFANSRGGHIIIGVDEQEGVPTRIVGVDSAINLDAEIQRMVQIINNGFDPAFTSVQFRSVAADDGTRCVILDIPRSAIAPHRVAFGKYHKFFVRDSNGKHEATMPELKNLFTIGELGRRRFREFCRDRVGAILDPVRDTTGVFTERGVLVCHIVPQVCLLTDQSLDIDSLYMNNSSLLQAFATMGVSRRYNFDGFIVYSGGDQLMSYTQIYRHGAVEAVMGDIHHDVDNFGKTIAGISLERDFFEMFPRYLKAYATIDIPPPYIVQITLAGVLDAYYAYIETAFGRIRQPKLDRDRLFLRECTIDSVDSISDIHMGIKPAFDSLYNALDQASCPNFSDDGIWQAR